MSEQAHHMESLGVAYGSFMLFGLKLEMPLLRPHPFRGCRQEMYEADF
jgi:hypothetical protein